MSKQLRVVRVVIDERTWQSLQFEADLLTQVFDHPFSPEDVARVRVELGRPAPHHPAPGVR
jgi:hypothetical protein